MPIYEYSCRRCESAFELLVRGQETPECPECGSHKLQKLLSVPAAPAVKKSSPLPVCAPEPGNCGRPQCGGGRCAMDFD